MEYRVMKMTGARYNGKDEAMAVAFFSWSRQAWEYSKNRPGTWIERRTEDLRFNKGEWEKYEWVSYPATVNE